MLCNKSGIGVDAVFASQFGKWFLFLSFFYIKSRELVLCSVAVCSSMYACMTNTLHFRALPSSLYYYRRRRRPIEGENEDGDGAQIPQSL